MLNKVVELLTERVFDGPPLGAKPFPDGVSMKGVSLRLTDEELEADAWRLLRPAMRLLSSSLDDARNPPLFGAMWTAYMEDGCLKVDVVTERDASKVLAAL